MSADRKKESKQQALNRKLDEIAKQRAKEREEERYPSYCMHTPPEALKVLSERSRSHLSEEELKRKYRRIRKR